MDKDGNVPKISTLKLYAGHILCALGLFWGVFSTFWSWPTDPTVTDGCVAGHPYVVVVVVVVVLVVVVGGGGGGAGAIDTPPAPALGVLPFFSFCR